MDIFLVGEPPANIKAWIIDHYKTPLSFWEQISKNLENEPNCTKKTIGTEDDMVDGVLPSVGTTIPVDYVVDPLAGPVKSQWQVLGYNMSIPERIKYKNGNDVIYVTTIGPGGLLSSIGEGTLVYADKSSSDSIGTVFATSGVDQVTDGNLGTYGNNNPYNVPTSLSVGGKEYSFAGWNMTLMSKCGVAAKYDNTLYVKSQFNSANRNNWSASQMRAWMNGSLAVENQQWQTSNNYSTTGTITGLLSRLPDEKFLNAISLCVNKTWVHDSWRSGKTLDSNYCEHVVDKFWLLGEGNINTIKDDWNDAPYDTSKFTGVFTSDTNSVRIRKYMNEDGSEGSACPWWLRSARSSSGNYVGYVGNSGGVYNYRAHNYSACSPVCLIQ